MTQRERRWNGWGFADTTYDLEHRPAAWPFLAAALGLDPAVATPSVALESVRLRPSRLSAETLDALRALLGDSAVTTGDTARLRRSLGMSYRDLIHLRRGEIPNPTDVVVSPDCEDVLPDLLKLAEAHGLDVIPFGGGTTVVGGVEPLGARPAITVDLARLNRVLTIDEHSLTVTAEAGCLGPDLEAALNERGLTLNHFPQSFELSSLGGWVATRSAGQVSTKYGKIEDMVVGARMATPRGWVEPSTVPASASGPSLLQMLVGSEGAFGIITQATLRIRSLPQFTHESGWLFPDFASGVEAVRAMMQSGLRPALARLNDETETRATYALREARRGWAAARQSLALRVLKRAGRSFERGALLLLRFEGEDECALHEAGHARDLCRANDGYGLGASPVRGWRRERFHTPYLRDVLLDHGLLVDTLETATEWNNVEALHKAINAAITASVGAPALVLTHLSHVYRDGASLYVTFVARSQPGRELEQWQAIKNAATDAIMRAGGALSHHHGIGYEHARWLAQAGGATGLEVLRAVKRALDPAGIMNPGKLV